MRVITVDRLSSYDKIIECPPDKSVSVRAVVLCGFAEGESVVHGISRCDDVMSAVGCMRALGAKIRFSGNDATITGVGGKPESGVTLDCGNSGTTAKLLVGLLAGAGGEFTLVGDASLSARSFSTAVGMLRRMGCDIDGERLPLTVRGGKPVGADLSAAVPSAQDKSAALLAGIGAAGVTRYSESVRTRDHTELMLEKLGADITVSENTVAVRKSVLRGAEIYVPGDITSAVYPICIALAVPGGRCTLKNVCFNPTRIDHIAALVKSGADITHGKVVGGDEPICDITVRRGELRPIVMSEAECARAVDEVPTLCALACFINGTSVFRGADKLRGKETDRVETTLAALRAVGGDAEYADGAIVVRGGRTLRFGTVDCRGDHRIAMTAAVLGACGAGCAVTGGDCVSVSYPRFFEEVLGV